MYDSAAHWMEIDLLRAGTRTANLAAAADAEYYAYLSRAGSPRRGFVWPIFLRDRLPIIGVPLRHGDPDAPLALQAAFDHTHNLCSYDLDMDYSRDPVSPLQPEAAEWARQLTAAWTELASSGDAAGDANSTE